MVLLCRPSPTMKILTFVICICYILPVQLEDTDRYNYCKSCLTAAQEIEKAMKEAPPGNRQTVVKNLISGAVCKKLQSYEHDHIPKDKLVSSCTQLFDSHHVQFHEALKNEEPKNLYIVLCYEQSSACVGVKQQSFEDSKATFTESDIDSLLWNNKEKVRTAQPIRSGSMSDEL